MFACDFYFSSFIFIMYSVLKTLFEKLYFFKQDFKFMKNESVYREIASPSSPASEFPIPESIRVFSWLGICPFRYFIHSHANTCTHVNLYQCLLKITLDFELVYESQEATKPVQRVSVYTLHSSPQR